MNFTGWVAIPRSVLSNTHTDRLSNTEQLVFLTLYLLADAKTGSGHINAAALIAFLPEMKYDTSKRVLQSLQDKGFIYRRITHASKKLYSYWIHGYQISDGVNRLLWTNLSEVFVTKDISAIRYQKAAPEMPPDRPPDVSPDIPPDVPLNNNKDTDKDTHKDNPSGSMRGESFSEGNGERDGDSRSEHIGESVVSEWCADGERMDALPPGYEVKDGYGGRALYGPNGLKCSPTEISNLQRNGAAQ